MIKSTDAIKVSLIVNGINSDRLRSDAVITLSPKNKSDSLNAKGSHMKFDSSTGSYYMEIKEGVKESFTSDSISMREIKKKPRQNLLDELDVIFNKLLKRMIVELSVIDGLDCKKISDQLTSSYEEERVRLEEAAY